jgi:ribosomal protection tetracycline resistance protein
VLVVSAVQGIQAQTRVLMRTLTRLRIPTLLFVNKVDRPGARRAELLPELRRHLSPWVVEPNLDDPGRLVDTLADHDESLLRSYVEDGDLPPDRLAAALADQTHRALAHPVYFGSAITGEGVPALMRGIRDWLPVAAGRAGDRLSARVFKVERVAGGEKTGWLRIHSGTLRNRQRVAVGGVVGRVTGLRRVVPGGPATVTEAGAGDIVVVSGLPAVRTDDEIHDPARPAAGSTGTGNLFALPALESVVRPGTGTDPSTVYAALSRLEDEDPLIGVRRDAAGQITVTLYGEVQKEVLAARLAAEYGIAVVFEETRVVYVERPVGVGTAVRAIDRHGGHDFWATVGLRVAPAPAGSGVTYRVGVERGLVSAAFHAAIEDTVHATLRQGPHGWEVVDCAVTLVRVGFQAPISTAGDFRDLTPMVLLAALAEAGTRVHEPVDRVDMEAPPDTVSAVLARLAEIGGVPRETTVAAGVARLHGTAPAGRVHERRRQLSALTRGEGVLLSRPAGYRPVTGEPPRRARTDGNPLNREEYLRHLAGGF